MLDVIDKAQNKRLSVPERDEPQVTRGNQTQDLAVRSIRQGID